MLFSSKNKNKMGQHVCGHTVWPAWMRSIVPLRRGGGGWGGQFHVTVAVSISFLFF